MLECKKCPAGYFNTVTGASDISSCNICNNNQHSFEGAQTCDLGCLVGFGQLGDGVCKRCTGASGYSDEAGTGACEQCETGPPTEDRSACNICSSGKYYFNGVCRECIVGMYQNEGGQSSCKLCAMGQYSTVNAINCDKCAIGYGLTGTVCNKCDSKRTYNDVTSGHNSICSDHACPIGMGLTMTSSNERSKCTVCSSGFFSDVASSGQCEALRDPTRTEVLQAYGLNIGVKCKDDYLRQGGTNGGEDPLICFHEDDKWQYYAYEFENMLKWEKCSSLSADKYCKWSNSGNTVTSDTELQTHGKYAFTVEDYCQSNTTPLTVSNSGLSCKSYCNNDVGLCATDTYLDVTKECALDTCTYDDNNACCVTAELLYGESIQPTVPKNDRNALKASYLEIGVCGI